MVGNFNDIEKEELLKLVNEMLPVKKKIPRSQSDNILFFVTEIDKIINTPQSKRDNYLKRAKGLVVASKEDLKASSVLFDEKLYPSSILHLQQATEKIAKAYGLAFFMLEKSELKGRKGVGHKTPKVFIKICKRNWVDPYFKIMKIFHPSLKRDVDVTKLEKIINEKQVEFAKLSKEEIKTLLKLNEDIRKKIENMELEKQIYLVMKNFLKIILEEEDNLLEEEYKDLLKGVEKLFRQYFDIGLISSFVTLYILSVITYSHFDYTRYPDGEIKPEEYENLDIIKIFPEIWESLKECIEHLDKHPGILNETF